MPDPRPTITAAHAARRPILHATGLSDAMRCDYRQALQNVAELTATGWLLPAWVLVPLRWDLDWPQLDATPARPTAEAARHRRDLALHAWILDWWRHGCWPGARSPAMLGSELTLTVPESTRQHHLARLRDDSRRGGAVLAEHGALCPAGAVTVEARHHRAWWNAAAHPVAV